MYMGRTHIECYKYVRLFPSYLRSQFSFRNIAHRRSKSSCRRACTLKNCSLTGMTYSYFLKSKLIEQVHSRTSASTGIQNQVRRSQLARVFQRRRLSVVL